MRVTRPVVTAMRLHSTAVTMQRRARRAFRCASAAIGSGANDTAIVLSAITPAMAPLPTPSAAEISGVRTEKA
jgi:hypothetical protein